MAATTSIIRGEGHPMAHFGRTAANRQVSFDNASEAEIVRRAKAGDEQAYAEIIQRHQAPPKTP